MNNKKRALYLIYSLAILCIALFFSRTIFIGYKYLFLALLLPFAIIAVIRTAKNRNIQISLNKFWLPLTVLILYFFHFTTFPNVIKESVNIVFILATIFIWGIPKQNRQIIFFKLISILVEVVGYIAIIRYSCELLDIRIPFNNILFEHKHFALVYDGNFYCAYFIILVLFLIKLFSEKRITTLHFYSATIVALINIIMSFSRRGYIVFSLLTAMMFLHFIFMNGSQYRNAIKRFLLIISSIGLIGLTFLLTASKHTLSAIIFQNYHISTLIYKVNTFINPDETFSSFLLQKMTNDKSWEKMPTPQNNLFYNSDLKYDLTFWNNIVAPDDDLLTSLIKLPDGSKFIRLDRRQSTGWWQLTYNGRPVFFHKRVTYNLSFSYRVIQGDCANPFWVGWWVNEGAGYLGNQYQHITQIDSAWNKCEVNCSFKENHLNPIYFLNTMHAGSIIDIKDMRLTCNDTSGLPMYVDQVPDSVIKNMLYGEFAGKNNFTSPRTDRWKYAWELWQTKYNWKQKLFGHGFDYLEWYGEKFYNNPKRYDFPHNPIISSFLYSGIIGGIVYIWFLIMSLWLYWKKRKQLGIFFIMYLCCMFFCMFSGSSHFSFPLFAFLSFLPFVEYKDKQETDAVSNTTEQIVND